MKSNASLRKPDKMPSTEAQLLVEISGKLDRLVAILAAQGKARERQVEILAAAGSDSTFIGSVVGLDPRTIRNMPEWKRAKQAMAVANEKIKPAPNEAPASDQIDAL
jgi:hypothetical protein